MKLRNHWLSDTAERTLLKIIEWAQRQDKLVEDLTQQDIKEAIESYLREATHAN